MIFLHGDSCNSCSQHRFTVTLFSVHDLWTRLSVQSVDKTLSTIRDKIISTICRQDCQYNPGQDYPYNLWTRLSVQSVDKTGSTICGYDCQYNLWTRLLVQSVDKTVSTIWDKTVRTICRQDSQYNLWTRLSVQSVDKTVSTIRRQDSKYNLGQDCQYNLPSFLISFIILLCFCSLCFLFLHFFSFTHPFTIFSVS